MMSSAARLTLATISLKVSSLPTLVARGAERKRECKSRNTGSEKYKYHDVFLRATPTCRPEDDVIYTELIILLRGD